MTYASAYRRPTFGTKTARVWEIADQISQQAGRQAASKEVVAAFVREGGNSNTAATQYTYWKEAYGSQQPRFESAPGTVNSVILQMGRDGRLLVPQAIRVAMGIDDSTKLTARVEHGELRIVPQKLAFARLQALVKSQDKGEGSAVDELLAERRAEDRRS